MIMRHWRSSWDRTLLVKRTDKTITTYRTSWRMAVRKGMRMSGKKGYISGTSTRALGTFRVSSY